MNDLHQLISLYLDHEPDEESGGQVIDELTAVLQGDTAAQDRLVLNSYIHSQLIDLMDVRRVQQTVDEAPLQWLDELQLAGLTPMAAVAQKPMEIADRKWYRRPFGRVAAALVAAATLFVMYWYLNAPATVAQLTRTDRCKWEGAGGALPAGSLLHASQVLNLAEGRALVTFANGAQVLLEGPSQLRLSSQSAAELQYGRLGTQVPSHAIGFTISCPVARFIDLGTEFALRLDKAGNFEMHVFEGLIEVQFLERPGRDKPLPIRITEVRAMTYDAASGKIETKLCDPAEELTP